MSVPIVIAVLQIMSIELCSHFNNKNSMPNVVIMFISFLPSNIYNDNYQGYRISS